MEKSATFIPARLPDIALLSRGEAIQRFKEYLKKEEARVRGLHEAGGGGVEVAAARAAMVDAVLRGLFEAAAGAAGPLALVATGGYGRGLLNPHSDIDILFLYEQRRPAASVVKAVEEILYTLWDTGFKLGHAVRSVSDAVAQTKSDYHAMSAAIESRHIAGRAELFKTFLGKFRKQCVDGHEDAYLANRLEDMRQRHEKALGTLYVQEPHVKNGVGGLRDFHTLVWTTYVRLGTTDTKALVGQGLLARGVYEEMCEAYDFLLRVRNDLHYEEKRARDVLTLYLQGVVATHFEYPQRSILRRCEAFMKDYYHHTRTIRQTTTQVLESFEIERVRRTRKRGLVSFLARARPDRESFDGFYSEDGRCHPEHDQIFEEDPQRLMRVFSHTQLRHLRLSPELKDLMVASHPLIDRAFRYHKANRLTFEAILSRAGEVGRALRQMHRVGVLGRYLPEFGALDCLVQHEFFHRYTADEHTLRTIEFLDGVAAGDDPLAAPFQQVFQDMENHSILYLALLLHDTGRAENARHHEDASAELASKVARLLQIEGPRRRLLLFLVDHHLTLWKTATTKNVENPDTIVEFAGIVRRPEFLGPLYLLTYADSRGTSAESWNSWKASLMRQLYELTRSYFADHEAFRRRLAMPDADLREDITKRLPASYAEEIDAHFRLMPERYFRTRRAETIVGHLRVFRTFFENLRGSGEESLLPAYHWEARPEEGCSKLVVVSWNRNQLLARLAACLSAQGLNILAADIFTRGDDIALDIFRVCTTNWEPVTNERTLKGFAREICRAFASASFDPAEVPPKESGRPTSYSRLPRFPMRVFISNDIDPSATFVEIQALDRIGLLADLFLAFARHHAEVQHARINTTRGAALDTFTVTDDQNRKLGPQAIAALQAALESAAGVTDFQDGGQDES